VGTSRSTASSRSLSSSRGSSLGARRRCPSRRSVWASALSDPAGIGRAIERASGLVDGALRAFAIARLNQKPSKQEERDGIPGDGRQVTHAGRPLFYYVGDRRPGELRCQNVREFGGLWLVMRASGRLVR
jgi:Secreted repeat of unknown function